MHDIYYIANVFPWADFNEALTTSGALDHYHKYIENWKKVNNGNKEQLLAAINKLNPMRLLDVSVTNFTTKETDELFKHLIILVRAMG